MVKTFLLSIFRYFGFQIRNVQQVKPRQVTKHKANEQTPLQPKAFLGPGISSKEYLTFSDVFSSIEYNVMPCVFFVTGY